MDYDKAYEFALLTLCIWREARGEVDEAKYGVAWVVKNRVDKGTFGTGYAGVILKPFQFSSFNGMGKNGLVDANTMKFPIPQTDRAFGACLLAAKRVYEASAPDPTHGSQFYHDDSIAPPNWTKNMVFKVKLGKLSFYKED